MWLASAREACLRELRYLRCHPWDLALITWFPAVVLAVAWAIFSPGVATRLPIAVVDEDHSPGSRRLALAIDAVRSSRIAERPATLEDAWPLVRRREVYAVVHIPADWERRSRRADRLPVVLYTNEQFHAAGSTIAPDVTGAVATVAAGDALDGLARLGGGFSGAQHRAQAVRVELRTLYAPQQSLERVLAGTFLPVMLHLFVLGSAAYAIGREFRDRTARDWLDAARGSITAALAGKLLPLAAASFTMGLAIIGWFAGYRGWSAGGSLALWAAGLLTLLTACCAIPAMFVGLTGTMRVALAATAVLNVTAIAFAGLSYPSVSMTTAAKVWASFLPFKYYLDIQQGQWHMGAPAIHSAFDFAVLWLVFILAPLAIALPRLRALCYMPVAWGRR
jgi:ABC-2 type transport system permease protein